jgi:hypothetical protein
MPRSKAAVAALLSLSLLAPTRAALAEESVHGTPI